MPDQYWKQPDSIDPKSNSLPLSDKLMVVFYDRQIYTNISDGYTYIYAVSLSVFVIWMSVLFRVIVEVFLVI